MGSTSQRQEGRNVVLPTVDADIQVLNRAKDTCGIQPAQHAFDSARGLLSTIMVRALLLQSDGLQAHVCAGL